MVRTKFKLRKSKKSKRNIQNYNCHYCGFSFKADNGSLNSQGEEVKNMIVCPNCKNMLKNEA